MSEGMLILISQLQREAQLAEDDYRTLLTRYDDAMKRIQDMQAELVFLRQEVYRNV
jgi:uncharacterized protein involved in exopolysaccharide biosynthesis